MSNWTTVKVPRDLAQKIREISLSEGRPAWQVLTDAIIAYQQNHKKSYRLRNVSTLDKVSYYILKLVISVERFKAFPIKENYEWLEKVVNQIKERMGVDVGYILQVAKTYARTESKEDYVELNMVAKMAIADLIRLLM